MRNDNVIVRVRYFELYFNNQRQLVGVEWKIFILVSEGVRVFCYGKELLKEICGRSEENFKNVIDSVVDIWMEVQCVLLCCLLFLGISFIVVSYGWRFQEVIFYMLYIFDYCGFYVNYFFQV